MTKVATGQLTIYDQNDPIIAGAAPSTPAPDALWLDNGVTPNMLKRWTGTIWSPVGALDANYSTVISGINGAITTLNETTLPALEDGLLTKAEKTGIQTSSDIVAAEKKDIDALYNALYSNENLITKTTISTPKGVYDTAYTTLTTAITAVLTAPDNVALPAGVVTTARTALSTYADKLALLRTAMQTAQKTIEAQIQTETASGLSSALANYVTAATYGVDYASIQAQVDNSITTWFGNVEPTLANLPASAWTTTVDKDIHLGDIYYDTITGYAHRFMVSASIYSWARITDSDVTLALADAATAQDTADSKRRVFMATPVVPYDVGDLWTQGTSGDLMRCKTARTDVEAYNAADWEKASKYTDDTAVNNLEIGGRNILYKNLIVPYASGTLDSSQYVANGMITYERTAIANEGFYVDQKVVLQDTSDYMLRFDAKQLTGAISSVTIYNTLGHTMTFYLDGVSLGTTSGSEGTYAIPLTDGLKHSIAVKFRTKVGMQAGSYAYLGSIIQFNKTIATAFKVELTRLKLERGVKATDWSPAPEDVATAISTAQSNAQGYVSTYIAANIQSQIDGKMESYAQDADPSVAWTTTPLKDLHNGDLWYHLTNKITKRWNGTAWVTLADAEAQAAASLAATKGQVFIANPTGPYAVNDLWVQGTSGDLMRCITASVVNGSVYNAAHWTKAVKYTDDTIASAASTAAATANGNITNIISDNKLTGNEKPDIRREWDSLVSAAILNSTQAGTFSVSVTAYQNAIAALGLYLNAGVAFTYANATAGTIPSWISDANIAVTTDIVGATYRSTWKTYYDAHVSLLNAIALKAKTLADTAQTTADSLEFGGRNLVQQAAIIAYNTSITSYVAATNIWNLSIANGITRGGLQLTGTTVRIPYGRTYVFSFEVFSPYATTWSMDNNDYPVSGGAWAGNDNDNGTTRKNSSTTITAGQWVKCWYSFANTNALNTLKVDIYDGTNFGINNASGSTQNIQIRNVKGELGTKPTEWTPAPEDVQSQITASSNNLNSLRQAMDNTKAIRLGMKIDYSAFSTIATGYLYLCGLQINPTTFVEELADIDGSMYGSFYNSTNGLVEQRVTIPVTKQAVNLNGVTVGTAGFLIWDNTAKAVWFIHFIKTIDGNGVVTAEYWNKRNVGKVGDNTEIVLDASTYVIGELEI